MKERYLVLRKTKIVIYRTRENNLEIDIVVCNNISGLVAWKK